MDEKQGDFLAVSLGICCGILLAEFWRWKREKQEELREEIQNAPEFVITSRGRRIPASHFEFAGVDAIGKVAPRVDPVTPPRPIEIASKKESE